MVGNITDVTPIIQCQAHHSDHGFNKETFSTFTSQKKVVAVFLKVLLSHENFCSTELRIPDTAELHIPEKNHKSCSDGIIPVDVETLTAGKPITKKNKNNYHTLQFMVQLVSSTLPAGSLAI